MLGRDIYYSTKGDANGVVDEELVNKNYVLGSVRSSYPTIGIVVMALKTPLGIILGTLLPLSIFMYLHIRPKSYSY